MKIAPFQLALVPAIPLKQSYLWDFQSEDSELPVSYQFFGHAVQIVLFITSINCYIPYLLSIFGLDCEPRHATRIHEEEQSSGEKRWLRKKEKKVAEEFALVKCLFHLTFSPNWHNFKFSNRAKDLRSKNRLLVV